MLQHRIDDGSLMIDREREYRREWIPCVGLLVVQSNPELVVNCLMSGAILIGPMVGVSAPAHALLFPFLLSRFFVSLSRFSLFSTLHLLHHLPDSSITTYNTSTLIRHCN